MMFLQGFILGCMIDACVGFLALAVVGQRTKN